MDKYIGRLLDNRYEILEVIGTGGMAVVYKARCHRLNRLVAIKILKDDFLEDEEFRRRFHSESQAVGMLTHPNIVSVYDVSTSITLDYIVMELIDGITLKQYMEKKGVLNWKETLHFAIQIAKALDHAHSRGIVHRDIKPHNVMVLKNGSVKVTDFGIARMMSKGNTLTKEALGSVHYISPEQAKGGRVDNRSDLYSLGVVMYEMMSGRPPYDGESPVSVAIQHINGGAVMPSTLNPNIPGGLEQIIMKAMAHEPANRYTTATQMLSDLDEFRKDPAILFDYNIPPIDAVIKMPKPAVEVEQPKPKTTAEQAERRVKTDDRATGVVQRRQTPPQRRRTAPSAQQKKSAEEEKSNKITTIAIISCAAVMVLAIVVFLIVLLTSGTAKKVEVPNLLGLVYENISKDQYDFNIKVELEIYDDEHDAGVIIGQNPAAGGEVVKNGTVRVTVSKGKANGSVVMPNLSGKTLVEAKAELDALKLNLQIKTVQQHNETVAAEHVISANVETGAQLQLGQEIILYVSMGTEIKSSTMPDIVGDKKESALTILKSQNLELDIVINEVFDSKVAAGIVISTDPATGGELEAGQTVTINVSKGAELKEVPKVVSLTIGNADAILSSAGFKYKWEAQYSTTVKENMVISQSVDPYTQADVSQEILLIISKGPKKQTFKIPEDIRAEDGCSIKIEDPSGNVVHTAPLEMDDSQIAIELGGAGIQKYKVTYLKGNVVLRTETVEVDFDK